ncbi:MAG: hypothetical protein AAF750_03580 [Planctomycetota bacterium]
MTKLNLIIIGAQKAATTWLARVLNEHPDVYMSPGEPQFSNRDYRTVDEYDALFDAGEGKLWIGEKTPD